MIGLLPVALAAQLCTGSLGDAVVNITFGSNGGVNPGVTPSASYTFTGSACPNDGFFSVTKSSAGCFSNTWHTINGDHTGDGAFMLVNASCGPGDFFVSNVSGLCPNTTYEFAAWVMNVITDFAAIKPNITFSIETTGGVILNQFNTGGIDATGAPTWKQYGFFFTTAPGVSDVILRMTNNAPGGIGNDLALDDITFRPCGPVLNSSVAGNSEMVNVCVDAQAQCDLSAQLSPGFLSPVFQWQVTRDNGVSWSDIPGATTLNYPRNPTAAGIFKYRLTVAENGNAGLPSCRTSSNILTFNVEPLPTVNAGIDRMIVAGDEITMTATATGNNLSYSWWPLTGLSDPGILNPVVTVTSETNYTLEVSSELGCMNYDDVLIKVVAGIFVPTAFTPNGNSTNDYWEIPYLDPFAATVSVFNRTGQLVYRVTGSPVKWDGKMNGVDQPTGTYVYLINFHKSKRIMKGTLTLIR